MAEALMEGTGGCATGMATGPVQYPQRILIGPVLFDTSSLQQLGYRPKAATPDRGSATELQATAISFHRMSRLVPSQASSVETGPSWLAAIHDELFSLKQLPDSWDGHGGVGLRDS